MGPLRAPGVPAFRPYAPPNMGPVRHFGHTTLPAIPNDFIEGRSVGRDPTSCVFRPLVAPLARKSLI